VNGDALLFGVEPRLDEMRSNKIQYGTVALGEVGVWTGKDEGHHVRMGSGQRERHLIFDADTL